MPNNEFGDFQTPLELARQCLTLMKRGSGRARVLEPTCGTGTFLRAASEAMSDSERVGIEIQPEHATAAAAYGKVANANIFSMRLNEDVQWDTDGPLLVVGNPPWVTSAELNRMDSNNLPKKENFKGARGLDAILGASNFDVCEYIILKLLTELSATPMRLGMLCKTQVARNVIEYAFSTGLPVTDSAIHRIDAMKWFNAGVDACWFMVVGDPTKPANYTTALHDDLTVAADPVRFGIVGGKMVSDIRRYEGVRDADGVSPYTWRSGLKHDASGVFELSATPEPATKSRTRLDIESDYIFPLLKSTDIFRGRHTKLSKWVIVPQSTFGAETSTLEYLAPNLWAYLNAHGEALDGRKSSIYRNRPRFTVFGHGPYTYAPYKVVTSGLHKSPVFRLVTPINGKPVVLDDTCYFIPFEDAAEALAVWALLSSPECADLVESLVFWDSKRPITKKLLARLDLTRLPVDRGAVLAAAKDEVAKSRMTVTSAAVEAALDATMAQLEAEDALF